MKTPSCRWVMGNRRPSASTTAAVAASGSSARTRTPSGPGCAPSTECGSWWMPATIRSISPAVTPAAWSAVPPVCPVPLICSVLLLSMPLIVACLPRGRSALGASLASGGPSGVRGCPPMALSRRRDTAGPCGVRHGTCGVPAGDVARVSHLSCSCQCVCDGAERDVHPGGPVPRLVQHLVDRFVQGEGAHEDGMLCRIRSARPRVPGAEHGLVAPHPVPGRRSDLLGILMPGELEAGGVVEWAHHPRHLAQRVDPAPPLR